MKWIVGIDEVGRGPLAGAVYVCAVAMPYAAYQKAVWRNIPIVLKDSKQMTSIAREKWRLEAELLCKKGNIKIAISNRTAAAIDKKGIAVCIRECIASNLKKLNIDPKDCTVLLDGGLKAPAEYKNQQTIIRGDDSQKIISLASVVAKVERDHYMIALDKRYPGYSWHSNKGYGTAVHIVAIKKWGITPFHRQSFLKKLLLP